MSSSTEKPNYGWLIAFVLIAGTLFAGFILNDINPQTHQPLTDQEQIEAGAAKIDAYCSTVDSC